jgi:hypothetical protein
MTRGVFKMVYGDDATLATNVAVSAPHWGTNEDCRMMNKRGSGLSIAVSMVRRRISKDTTYVITVEGGLSQMTSWVDCR